MRAREFITEEQMDDITKSLWSLAKYNDGKYKSEKQGKYLLSKTYGGEYVAGGSVYNNSYNFIFRLDDVGIVTIYKSTKKNTGELVWERPSSGKEPIQQTVAKQQADKHAAKLSKDRVRRIDTIRQTIQSYYDNMDDDPRTDLYYYDRIIELKHELEGLTGETQDTTRDVKHYNDIIQAKMQEIENKLKEAGTLDQFISKLKNHGIGDDEIPNYAKHYQEFTAARHKEYDEWKDKLK